jgi:hypothetical protein
MSARAPSLDLNLGEKSRSLAPLRFRGFDRRSWRPERAAAPFFVNLVSIDAMNRRLARPRRKQLPETFCVFVSTEPPGTNLFPSFNGMQVAPISIENACSNGDVGVRPANRVPRAQDRGAPPQKERNTPSA